MTTQPLKEILEQANLPWSEKLNDEWLLLDKDGLRIARADSIYHDDRTLILHCVNTYERAIEALKRAAIYLGVKEHSDMAASLFETIRQLETVQTP